MSNDISNTLHAECHGGVLQTVREFHKVWRVVIVGVVNISQLTVELCQILLVLQREPSHYGIEPV